MGNGTGNIKVTHMDQRIGILNRDGQPVYYARLGRVMVEGALADVEACLARFASKLPEWDKLVWSGDVDCAAAYNR